MAARTSAAASSRVACAWLSSLSEAIPVWDRVILRCSSSSASACLAFAASFWASATFCAVRALLSANVARSTPARATSAEALATLRPAVGLSEAGVEDILIEPGYRLSCGHGIIEADKDVGDTSGKL